MYIFYAAINNVGIYKFKVRKGTCKDTMYVFIPVVCHNFFVLSLEIWEIAYYPGHRSDNSSLPDGKRPVLINRNLPYSN